MKIATVRFNFLHSRSSTYDNMDLNSLEGPDAAKIMVFISDSWS